MQQSSIISLRKETDNKHIGKISTIIAHIIIFKQQTIAVKSVSGKLMKIKIIYK